MSEKKIDVVDEASRESFPASDAPAWQTDPVPLRRDAHGRSLMNGVLMEGALAGLIGYAAIAVFFAIASVIAGNSPLHIAALLGTVFFSSTAAEGTAPGPALAYNGVHLIVMLLAGVVFAWLASIAARALQGWYIALIAVLFVFGHVVAVPIWFDARIRDAMSLWLIVAGTTLGTVAMGAYLWHAYPGILRAMHEPDESRHAGARQRGLRP